MIDRNITAVLGVRDKQELFEQFYVTFRRVHPTVPLVVSALQSEENFVRALHELEQKDVYLTVVSGNPVDGHRVSFSENYNSALNHVTTEKCVLIHTDMYFDVDFFDNLERDIKDGEFRIYTTMEPPIYLGHRRPGKIIGDFGTNHENFNEGGFLGYCRDLKKVPEHNIPAYGFFLAGYLKDFEEVGGFDHETYTPVFCEDDDFMVRLRSKGFRAVVSEHAICYHFVSQTTRSMAGAAMQPLEVASNKSFFRKWGFEARFLWGTGYEGIAGPLKIYKRVVAVTFQEQFNHRDVELMEPIADYLRCPGYTAELNSFEEFYNKAVAVDAEIVTDIEIKVLKPNLNIVDIERLVQWVGTTRFTTNIRPGKYSIGDSFEMIVNPTVDTIFKDTQNYLFLQKEIRYE